MDPRKTNQVCELPIDDVASMLKNIITPLKEENAPEVFDPQKSEGTCGVLAMSTSFAYMFYKKISCKDIFQ